MKLIETLLKETTDVDCGYAVDAELAAALISRVVGREIQPDEIDEKKLAYISHAYQQAFVEWIYDHGVEVKGFAAPSHVWDVVEEISKTL